MTVASSVILVSLATQQGFYVAGTWNITTSTFTVSAPLTPGNDSLVFTVAAGTGNNTTTYGAFASGNFTTTAAFFTGASSAFIFDFVKSLMIYFLNLRPLRGFFISTHQAAGIPPAVFY